jgi:DNA-binding PadR family transcriptional regulator
MKHNHNAFENQIFNHYRINKKKIEEAIKFLQEHGYIVYEKTEVPNISE